MTKTIVILAAGMSSRMKKSIDSDIDDSKADEANKKSKSLITFGDKPFIYFLLKNIVEAGFENVIMVVGKDFDDFKKQLNNLNFNNKLKIDYAIQKIPKDRVKPFGTADAVFQTMDQIEILKNSSFCVCNSDNLYSTNSLRTIRENAYENAVLAYDRDSLNFPKERVSSFSILMTDDNFNLLNFIEKPTQEQVDQNLDSNGKIRVSMNIFKFNGLQAFDFIKNCPINPIRNEKELPSAIVNMINENDLYMKGIPIAEHVPDLTSKADINIIQKLIE
ncbi:MAG: nucleotidyltransferase [Cryomorphaceae bacterium]|nr:MAG: nucleotidyltransferase [Cryomorphaceae bacterium]|tara:strand:+ start:1504 stop:2331 length:828 start_codon:yes stop_codon:yes gene_type:complete